MRRSKSKLNFFLPSAGGADGGRDDGSPPTGLAPPAFGLVGVTGLPLGGDGRFSDRLPNPDVLLL
jgi:hypothetical protein